MICLLAVSLCDPQTYRNSTMEHMWKLPVSSKLKSFLHTVFMIVLIELVAGILMLTCAVPFIRSCSVVVKDTLLQTLFFISFTAPLIAFVVIRPYIIAKLDLIEKLDHLAKHDSLTGLYNRRAPLFFYGLRYWLVCVLWLCC